MVHAIAIAEKFYDPPFAKWRPKKASGIISHLRAGDYRCLS
jgi:hypothetical protein